MFTWDKYSFLTNIMVLVCNYIFVPIIIIIINMTNKQTFLYSTFCYRFIFNQVK